MALMGGDDQKDPAQPAPAQEAPKEDAALPVPSPLALELAKRGGAVWKCSDWLLDWRRRWMLLSDDKLTFFAEDSAAPSPQGAAAAGLGPLKRRQLTVSLPLADLRSAWAVDEARFGRPCCFVLHLQAAHDSRGRQVGVQAANAQEQEAWVQVLQRALIIFARRKPAPPPAPSLPSAPAKAKAAPPPAPPPKAKAKAPAAKAPPPPKAKRAPLAKAVTVAKPPPPLGRRLQVKAMDTDVKMEETVFSSMLDVEQAAEEVPEETVGRKASLDEGLLAQSIREAFTQRDIGDRGERARRSIEEAKRRSSKKALIDERVAQNMEIVLRKFPVSIEELCNVVQRMELSPCLAAEDFDHLREVLPGPEQLRVLREFPGDPSELRGIEQQLRGLAVIDRLAPRLHVLALEKSLLGWRQQLLQEATVVRSACEELMASPLLRDLLEAVLRMFNFVNHGNERLEKKTVRGFDITSAIRIAEFKATGFNSSGSATGWRPKAGGDLDRLGNYTGLHFCVSQILAKKPLTTCADFLRETKSLAAAGGINLRCVARGISELSAEVRFLEHELKEHREMYSDPAAVPGKPGEVPKTPEKKSAGEDCIVPKIRVADVPPPDVLPQLSPVPEESSARVKQLSSRSFVVASPRGIWDRLSSCLGSPVSGAVWIREIMDLRKQEFKVRPRCRWRRVRVGPGHVLEVHGSTAVRVFGLPGALVEPWARSGALASPASKAKFSKLLSMFSYGFELTEQGSRSGPVRFACESSGELERWMSVFRSESKSADAGWLQLLRAATRLRREKCRRYWFSLDSSQLLYYKSPSAAWRAPSKPLGYVPLADWACSVADCIPGNEREAQLDVLKEHPCSFAVYDSEGVWHTLVAEDEASFARWLEAIRAAKGVAVTEQELASLELGDNFSTFVLEHDRQASCQSIETCCTELLDSCTAAERSVSSSVMEEPLAGETEGSPEVRRLFSPELSRSSSPVGSDKVRKLHSPKLSRGSSPKGRPEGGRGDHQRTSVPPQTMAELPGQVDEPDEPDLLSAPQTVVPGAPPPVKQQVPSLNLQNLSFRLEAANLMDGSNRSVISDTESDSTADESLHAGSSNSSLLNSADGSSVFDPLMGSSGRLPPSRRLEQLMGKAKCAEVEVRAAVLQTCNQSVQTMRFFGQPPLAIDNELSDIVPFANSTQHFLQAVHQLVSEVATAWREIEQQQQARARRGTCTPSDFSVRSQRAQQERRRLKAMSVS